MHKKALKYGKAEFNLYFCVHYFSSAHTHLIYMNRIILTLLFICPSLSAWAGGPWLKRPLRFIEPDSVVTWGYDGRDFRRLALQADSTARGERIPLTRPDFDARKRSYTAWKAAQPELNLAGGEGHPLYDPQGLSAAKWTVRAAQLFLMQGDACYADFFERVLYNAALHTATDTTLRRGTIDKFQAACLLLSAPGMMYATSSEADLYVNLYTNSTAAFQLPSVGHVTLDQVTDMPISGAVKIRFTQLKGSHRFSLHLRVPDWTGVRSTGNYVYVPSDSSCIVPSIFVNGHEVEPLCVDEKGYVVIEREWKSLDEVYVDFPLRLQRALLATHRDALRGAPIAAEEAAFQWGPLVYFIPSVEARGCYVTTHSPLSLETNSDSLTGYPILRGTMYRSDGAVQDAEAPSVEFRCGAYGSLKGR